MPSGAKKRKAAKKKKEKEANSNSLHGDDDHKVHEEKESDGGDTSSIQSAVTESESLERVNGNEEIYEKTLIEQKNSIQIMDRVTKLEDDLEPKAVNIEHVEFEDVYTSSSSSSDDESKFVDKNIEVINWEEPIEYACDSPKLTQVNEIVSHNLAPVSPNEKSTVHDHNRDRDHVIEKSKVEVPNLELLSLSKDEDLGSKVKGKSEILEVVSSVVDTGSQYNVDILSTKETEDCEVTEIPFVEKDKSETLPQSSTPPVYKVNGDEHKKGSEIESMDRRTREALPLQPVQATSSMGCCGLFELFMGSKR